MGSLRQFSNREIGILRSVVDDDTFVKKLAAISSAYRHVTDTPIPSPVDSEVAVKKLIADTKTLLRGLQDADSNGHPLALSMSNKGMSGGVILHTAKKSLESLLDGLVEIRVMARPGHKKRRGPKGKDNLDQWLADSVVDLLDLHGVEVTKYKGNSLAKCINVARCAAGFPSLEDPCYQIEIRHITR